MQYEQLMGSKDAQERQFGISLCHLDYENLYRALELCLEQQEDISIFVCLDEYFRLISEPQNRLRLMEKVCSVLEQYPSSFIESDKGYQVAFAFRRAGSSYLEIKHYEKAQESYQTALRTYGRLSTVEERQKHLWIAITYHELGRVAQALREYEQARDYYQQALQIKIEYNDRYSQASTYYQLGELAEVVGDWESAKQHYLEDLRLSIETKDEAGLEISKRNLARFYQATRDEELLHRAATLLGTTANELKQAMESEVEE